jgi:hypothetical protein
MMRLQNRVHQFNSGRGLHPHPLDFIDLFQAAWFAIGSVTSNKNRPRGKPFDSRLPGPPRFVPGGRFLCHGYKRMPDPSSHSYAPMRTFQK